jgi:hypothetical protein
MNYELIGAPRIEAEYSDEWETVMVCDLKREDGQTGDVWIVAGVPDYQRGSSEAARTQHGYETVRVFGDSPDHWCPESFRPADGEYPEVAADIVTSIEDQALATHRERREAEA